MYTRTFFNGFLMPSIGVGVVHAKGEQDKEDCDDSRKLVRARELPLYVEPPQCVTCSNKIENDEGFLITTIRCVRQEFQQIIGQARMIQVEAQNIVEEVKKETEDVVSYLRQEENLLPRLGAIGLGGFAGYLLACRKGMIKKTLYSATGAGLIAAVAYPNQAKDYTEEVMCEVKKYAVIGYHFLNGADVDWKKLEKIKPPCFSQKDGVTALPAEGAKPKDTKDKEKPEPEEKGKPEPEEKGKPDPDQTGDKPPLTEKEKPKPDPCIDKVKAAERSGPDDKRSYTERCRERGNCGVPKKKPAVNGDKTATLCDPGCAGPKRGLRTKRNDSESKSRTSPVVKEPENCPLPEQPAARNSPPCPPGCMPDPCKLADQIQQLEKEPEAKCTPSSRSRKPTARAADQRQQPEKESQQSESTPDLCQPSVKAERSPDNQSGCFMDTRQPSGMTEASPPQDKCMNPCYPSGEPKDSPQTGTQEPLEAVCRGKRRVAWRERNQQDNGKELNSSVSPQNSGKAGDVEQSPITDGVTNGSQERNTGSDQSNIDQRQFGNEGSEGNRGAAVRDPSDPCRSTIKRSSVTITYPNPPGHADSRVIMNQNDGKACGRPPIQPKEVTMGSHRRRPEVQRVDGQPAEPRQTTHFRSRRRRETQSEMNEP